MSVINLIQKKTARISIGNDFVTLACFFLIQYQHNSIQTDMQITAITLLCITVTMLCRGGVKTVAH